MIKLLPVIIFFVILLTPIYPVYAQDSTTSARPTITLKERLEQQRAKLNNERALSSRLGNRIDNIASREAQLRAKRDALKTKLGTFKDKRKADLVEKINTDLDAVNKRRTAHMSAVLEMLTKLVEKVEAKTQSSSASEEAKQKVNTQVLEANVVIDDAKNAVATQSAKEYTIKISSESAARSDAKVARDTLHKDLQSTHLQVREAREAVVALISSYRQLLGGVSGN